MAEPIRHTLRMVAERAAFEPYWVGISRETARDMLAHIRALEAEVARKDAALRRLIEHTEAMEAQNADYHRLGEQGIPCRSAPLNEAAAAVGPWMPTHQRQHGDFVREVARGRHAEDAGAMVAFDKVDSSLWFLAAYYFDGYMKVFDKDGMSLPLARRYRPLTPDEARAAVEGRS